MGSNWPDGTISVLCPTLPLCVLLPGGSRSFPPSYKTSVSCLHIGSPGSVWTPSGDLAVPSGGSVVRMASSLPGARWPLKSTLSLLGYCVVAY